MASPAIAIRAVSKQFGDFTAVREVSLDIAKGEIFGLIGHNGAGKSTLFKMMLGLIPLTAGSIRISGQDIIGPEARNVRRHIGYLPENVVLYDNLDGLETLKFFARLKNAPQSQCAAILEKVGLAHAGKRPVRAYSKGMRQRLGFAQALLGSPRVLFLDEPTNGLDPKAIREFYTTLRELQSTGVTVVITSHILAEMQERVDRLAILTAGEIQALGTVQELRDQLHMPITFEIDLVVQDAGNVAAQLRQATGFDAQATDYGLRLQCDRSYKLAVLGVLTAQGSAVTDIRMRMPSLEDVFFGLSE
ncbi:ABC transporter ATP-binding protein [Diaphorobacter sp. HDW4A]|uniref:ABC transporter ATP-binding protein n=1 Tax=Diaphorobacter sp. HDW4A TaxID=2714924 RepID=UPI0014095B69|nr:ABC transporter ATP-binding protein [Diaphorobacter sp. HDW4A]QIL78823.1 ABC transporter ATP-binding protein [Diaphorobacter sp. HDW4A]